MRAETQSPFVQESSQPMRAGPLPPLTTNQCDACGIFGDKTTIFTYKAQCYDTSMYKRMHYYLIAIIIMRPVCTWCTRTVSRTRDTGIAATRYQRMAAGPLWVHWCPLHPRRLRCTCRCALHAHAPSCRAAAGPLAAPPSAGACAHSLPARATVMVLDSPPSSS